MTAPNLGSVGRFDPGPTQSHLRPSWDGPPGFRLRLGRPADADAVARLAGDQAGQIASKGLTGLLLLQGVNGGAETVLPPLATALHTGVSTAIDGLSLVLVAEHGDAVTGVSLITPPAASIYRSLADGFDLHQVIMLGLTVAEVRLVAVAAHARGRAVGTALLPH